MAIRDADFDILQSWLQKIAENTAVVRDYAIKGGAGAGAGASAPKPHSDTDGSRFERAMDALGKRFESALSRWSRTPVEKLVDRGFDTAIRTLDRAATTLIGRGQNLMARGMAGTVEGARSDWANEQLGRQIAAIFMPITNAMTQVAVRTEGMLRGLGGSAQNRLMGAGIGGMAGYMMGGPMGALAGYTLGGMAMGGQHDNDMLRGGLAGAYLGFRAGGIPGAIIGGFAGAAAGSPVHMAGESPGEYRMRLRAAGGTRVGATVGMFGRGISMLSGDLARGLGFETDVGRAYGGTLGMGAGGAGRRDVTPFSAAMEDVGQGHFRLQEATIRRTAGAGYEDAGPLQPVVDLIIQGLQLLAKIAGVELREPPSVERAR